MTFQQTVRDDQGSGIVGEFAFDGPQRAFRYNLDSGDAANNAFGRAFTLKSGQDVDVEAGGAGVFIGIMVCPKQHALIGDASGTLNPSLVLPNGVDADFATMGQPYVQLANAATVGNSVIFNNTTGVLSALSTIDSVPAGSTQILGAKVVRCDTAGAGLAIIELTDQQPINPEA